MTPAARDARNGSAGRARNSPIKNRARGDRTDDARRDRKRQDAKNEMKIRGGGKVGRGAGLEAPLSPSPPPAEGEADGGELEFGVRFLVGGFRVLNFYLRNMSDRV
jgi:hypothetical protein